MASLFEELKRRNVIKVALVYIVAAWLLVQVADIMFESFGTPEWVMKTFIGFLALGLPIALIFAWAFEITPEGLKREKDVDRDESVTHETSRKLNYWVVGAMALAILYLAVDNYVLDDGSGAEPEQLAGTADEGYSIAVLPFVNMSNDPDNEYFSDGLSEELLNVLARIEDFRVAGRTSSFSFKGKDTDFQAIGKKLNVETILEGSVRKAGDQVRVTAQLISVDDGYHLWSESYDRNLDNIFEVQDEIATAVVSALKQTLLGEKDLAVIERESTTNVEAWNHYLRGNFHIRSRTKDDLEKAQQEFQLAVTLDPNFAEAWAGLADAYSQQAGYGFVNYQDIQPLAQAAIDRAMALNDQLSEVWASQALLYGYGLRWEEASRAAKRATELNPNSAIAWQRRGFNQPATALDKAIEYQSRAHELDPLDAVIMSNLASSLIRAGELDRARELAQQTIDLQPDVWRGYWTMSFVAAAQGRYDEQLRWLNSALERDPDSLSILADRGNTWLDLGDLERAEAEYEDARKLNPDAPLVVPSLAFVWFITGRQDEALALQYAHLADDPDNSFRMGDAALLELMAENEPRARELMEQVMSPEPGVEGWEVTDLNRDYAPYYALILHNANEPGEAQEVSNTVLAQLDAEEEGGVRNHWLYVNRALARGAVGEREAAVAALRAAVNAGWPGDTWAEHDPILKTLSDDLGYVALMDELRARRLEQLEFLYAEGI